jgi:excisionase family DNA binding protein
MGLMDDDALLTVEEAASRLKLHVVTVRKMLREGRLPGIKVGPRQWRVPTAALQQYVTNALATEKPAMREN